MGIFSRFSHEVWRAGAGLLALALLAFLAYGSQTVTAQTPTPTPTPTPSPTPTSTPAPLKVGAGVGSRTIAGNIFTPGEVTIAVNSSIMWTINSDEPHTVTFGQGPQGVPPPFWPNTFGIEESPAPVNLTASYSGTEFINTGVIFKGSTVTIAFNRTGTFPYICAIHPGMNGKVNVVAAGQPVTTQAQADAKALQTANAILGQEPALRQQGTAQHTSQTRPDSSKLWLVPTGPVTPPQAADGGSGYLEIQEYFPTNLTVTQGDTVRWNFLSPHTVTFGAPPPPARFELDPFAPPAKPSENYEGTGLFNSSVLGLGPGAPNTFELTFTKPGTYEYLCLLHWPNGQMGTITVQAKAAPPSPTPPPTTPAIRPPVTGNAGLSTDDGSSSWAIWLIVGISTLAVVGGLGLAARRVVR